MSIYGIAIGRGRFEASRVYIASIESQFKGQFRPTENGRNSIIFVRKDLLSVPFGTMGVLKGTYAHSRIKQFAQNYAAFTLAR